MDRKIDFLYNNINNNRKTTFYKCPKFHKFLLVQTKYISLYNSYKHVYIRSSIKYAKLKSEDMQSEQSLFKLIKTVYKSKVNERIILKKLNRNLKS